jgi:hypothetical protein
MVATNNFFACTETPLKFTSDAAALNAIKRSNECSTCKVRITSLVAGTGFVRPVAQGLTFDSPQTTLEFNGMRHSIQECLLTFPAMHSITVPGMTATDTSGVELQVKFRGETSATNNSYYTLVLPILVGDGVGAEFFASLGVLQRSRPTLASILSNDTDMLLFKGVDIGGRTVKNAVCDNALLQKVFYLVALKPLAMRVADYMRLKAQATAADVYIASKGPVVANAIYPTAKQSLISYIPNIIVTKSATTKTASASTAYVETAQIKCRPLNVSRDIKGDRIYVGGPGQYTTLQDELAGAADPTLGIGEPEGTFDVSRVESILAIVLGAIVGIVIISLIAWHVFKGEANYTRLSLLYATSRLKNTPSLNK